MPVSEVLYHPQKTIYHDVVVCIRPARANRQSIIGVVTGQFYFDFRVC